MTSYTDGQAKALITEIGRRLYERGFVSANDGNITVMTKDGFLWATPSGVSKGSLTEDMLLKTDLDGNIIEGTYKPTSELMMHLRVYRENAAVRAVVHAHPIAATTFSIARIGLDAAIMTESVLGLGVVPVAPYATAGTPAVADSIAPFCREYNAVLLANHGALTWGEDALTAYYRMESVETCAVVMKNLGFLKDAKPHLLTRAQVAELIDRREAFGITAGGVPRCSEDLL